MTIAHNGVDWSESPRWLLPAQTPEAEEFFAGAQRGELRVQRCRTCRRHQHYPRVVCSHCGADDPEWVTASGAGVIHSFTVIRQNGVPPFSERVPFVVALIDLDEDGARMMASMPTLAPEAARIGMRVRTDFRDVGDGSVVDFRADGG